MASTATEKIKKLKRFGKSFQLFYFREFFSTPSFFVKGDLIKNSDSLRILYGFWNRLQKGAVKEYTK